LVDQITGSRVSSQALVFRLGQKGLLRQIKRGAYAVRPRSGTLVLSALDLVGPVGPDLHLLTAGRALAMHGLSDQAFRSLVVLVPVAQRGWEWQGERVKYVVQPPRRIWGGREVRAARTPTIVARPERAILDSLSHPAWGVSLGQVVRALTLSTRDPAFIERLAEATVRYDNAAAARRLGFIVSRLASTSAAAPFRVLRGGSRAATPLVPGGPQGGPISAEWRIRENVPFALLAETDT